MALVPYNKTTWINNQSPARNEGNLNNQEIGIYDVTEETISQAAQILAFVTPAYTPYVPQVTPPAHQEGVLFYDNASKTFSGYNDIPDSTLNFAREQRIRVINNSGASIPNGTIVRQDGIDGATQRPLAVPAMANLFATSVMMGVTTHEIVDGAEGEVTTFGELGDVDTSAFSPGDVIFLSDTVPGGFIGVAPDIASKAGRVMVSGANGKMFVSLESTLSLPNIYGAMSGGDAGGTIAQDTYQPLVNYLDEDDVGMALDTTAGTINVPIDGTYRITVNLVINFNTIGNNKEDLFIGIYDGNTIVKEIKDFLGKDSEAGSFYPSFLFKGTGGTDYSVMVSSSVELTGVTYSLAEFDIESVHIRQ